MELTAEHILKEVSRYTNEDVTYIDALVFYAQKYDIEVELIGEIVKRSQVLKSRVRDDAERFNLLEEKTAQLPV
jgi:hypothetical protein